MYLAEETEHGTRLDSLLNYKKSLRALIIHWGYFKGSCV
jgi:hypothetical protein